MSYCARHSWQEAVEHAFKISRLGNAKYFVGWCSLLGCWVVTPITEVKCRDYHPNV